ncbi:hypothetical protein Nocox_36360 [Nonomuraea coxensis DSM 45129]|uniref:Uncharacterized protein n=1 Tax=Nonomuraea coxensis DSM 45129 TaxID=1122611 RepID=A0ABX8UAL4_9ACTN|nr:hypothetical protein [Nonomuraea coxensis]QYC44826.1 hypothetical protein Nocox_36360 [Nonomuraea coxensis DSM 45129]
MPKLKSLMAGLAISTAMTGAAVTMGAAAASATTPVPSRASVATGDWDGGENWDGDWNGGWGGGWGHHNRRHQRCGRGHWGGGGWGWGRRGANRICIVVRNHNRNINGQFENRRRHHHHDGLELESS